MPRDKLHDRVVQALGQQISSGVYAPGGVIPIEGALAEQFGVSRVVVREAIKILAAKGLVEVRTRTGTRVRPLTEWNLFDPQVMAWRSLHDAGSSTGQFADARVPTRKLAHDLVELRRIVEPAAARLAAVRADANDIRAIRAGFKRLAAAVDGAGDYVEADLAFHGAILSAARNQFLMQLQSALGETLKTSIALSSRDPERARRSLPQHADLLRAIERRDAEAAAGAVEQLIDLAIGEITRVFGNGPEDPG